MALFNSSADDAIQAALAMLHVLEAYNQDRVNTRKPPIRVGIGINTGTLMLGTIGTDKRMESTVISDTVNVASRIEQLTKVKIGTG